MPPLLPLPQCEGPKLQPFTQDFESIELEPELLIKDCDGFAHGMVLKAKIDGKTYAIKFFVQRWLPPETFIQKYPSLSDEEHALARIHDDPFYAECRAFGRLKETGMEHLAVKVHGYIKVETNERTTEMLRPAFSLEKYQQIRNLDDFFHDGNIDCETREHIPVMGIVKDWIDGGELVDQCEEEERFYRNNLENHQCIIRQASSNLENLHLLHKHGIVIRDLHSDQYINGKLVDLSYSWTTPHVLAQGDRFRPDWSLASLAARDLYEFQKMIQNENDSRPFYVRGLRKLGFRVPKIRPSKVVAYPRAGTRQGLRARRGPGDGKPLPLLNYRSRQPYDPKVTQVADPVTRCDAVPWTYGPKYDPAHFQWRKVGKAEGAKGDEQSKQDKMGEERTVGKGKKRKRG
ncbi:kinetochore Sim4 complex subunit FTA2-domain-containing protein [Plectosphaerella plurivora]|uniref:Kinetochore Sim4 complex subunit FTA2-domain-containing protein n=1 Tax=Plectosphaerella plurivora TaxID=936078 RepID=A0A9P8VI28_9PEZI|nr:kinetochore Sim4 complex subunit FTA2-domain-containing protein [Plectosphaerella plurivora]